LALTADELAQLPGYGRDVEKSRAEAKRLLAEAGARDLKFKLINRNVNHPFTPVGVYMVDQFRRIGVTAEHTQLDVSQQKGAIANGDYQVAIDAFCADTDDAGPLLLPYLSKERSPRNMTRNSNPQLDALYDKFRQSTDEAARVELAKDMQRKVISDANSIPVIWYSRIVAHGSNMKGWKIIPSHFANQDLAGIWLE
jgi:peptide/nickel transport system substrate-binding protein